MTTDEIRSKLLAPFAPTEVKFRPKIISQDQKRALAIAYIDARTVMERLDEVFGVDGWQDSYTYLPDGSVLCQLRCKFHEVWISKADVGSRSEQDDEGDRAKAAVSDALKRAAVHFGIGRYLYRLPDLWVDWDAQRKRFAQQPRLGAPSAATQQQPPARNGTTPATATPSQPAATGNLFPGSTQPPLTRPPQRKPPCITDDQRRAIERALEEKGIPEVAFLEHHAIAKVADLSAALYNQVMQRIGESRPARRVG